MTATPTQSAPPRAGAPCSGTSTAGAEGYPEPPAPGPAPADGHSKRAPAPSTEVRPDRPVLTELRVSAFAGLRRANLRLAPLTLLGGPSGSGKSTVLRACSALAQLASGADLNEVFPDPGSCVPESARPDAQGRRGFRLGCTVDGPSGPLRLDLAVQAEPELRLVGERLSCRGTILYESALRDPGKRSVQAAWLTAGPSPVTRAPLPDDLLGTAMLPLRVAGKTQGQRQVLAAAEQTVVALRSLFACDPQPDRMRSAVPVGEGRLLPGCDNLAEVLRRTHSECSTRHGILVRTVRAGCSVPAADVVAEELDGGLVRAVLDRGAGVATPVSRLGDGELRFLALALVLLTGPGVLAVDTVAEVPAALQTLTVLADGFDRCLDERQTRELARLAAQTCHRGHIRLIAAVRDGDWMQEFAAMPECAPDASGVVPFRVVDLGR